MTSMTTVRIASYGRTFAGHTAAKDLRLQRQGPGSLWRLQAKQQVPYPLADVPGQTVALTIVAVTQRLWQLKSCRQWCLQRLLVPFKVPRGQIRVHADGHGMQLPPDSKGKWYVAFLSCERWLAEKSPILALLASPNSLSRDGIDGTLGTLRSNPGYA